MRYSLCSADISTNVSDARFLRQNSEKKRYFLLCGTSSNIAAISTACTVRRIYAHEKKKYIFVFNKGGNCVCKS